MSSITSLEILLLSMLILGFLQLQPGIFALFLHYASGKFSYQKRSLLATFYILGTETAAAGLFIGSLLFANLFFYFVSSTANPEITIYVFWAFAAIMLLLAISMLVWYFRPGRGTKLFIPRRTAKTLESYARSADTRGDAFVLGALTSVLEIPFTLPLYLISAIALVYLTASFTPDLIFGLFIFIAPILPLIAIRLRYRLGANLATVLRARFRDKNLVRILLTLAYTTLAVIIVLLIFAKIQNQGLS